MFQRVHSSLKKNYNINIEYDEINISSLVFALNFLGINTNMSCGGHYKELDNFTNSNRYLYGRIGPQFPWINFRNNNCDDQLLKGIDDILEENLWVSYKSPNLDSSFLHSDLELMNYKNKLHVQQVQLESIEIASSLVKELSKSDVTKELDLFKEHYELLAKFNCDLNSEKVIVRFIYH